MQRPRKPALVIDRAIAKHLEVLGRVPLFGVRIIECVQETGPFHRRLRCAINALRFGESDCFKNGRCDVDYVAKLAT